jgi:hypothetical protein
MKRFKSPRQVQQFPSTHDQIANVFTRRPNKDTAGCRHPATSAWSNMLAGALNSGLVPHGGSCCFPVRQSR